VSDLLPDWRNRSVAVVGNGPSAQGHGEAIDACEIVIRFNNFRIDGFDVGNRTDVWVTSFYRDIEDREDWRHGRMVIMPFPPNFHCPSVARFQNKRAKHYGALRMPGGIAGVLKRTNKHPSTGIAFLWWFAWQLKMKPTVMVGFDHFSKLDHYFGGMPKTSHSPKREAACMKRILEMMEGE